MDLKLIDHLGRGTIIDDGVQIYRRGFKRRRGITIGRRCTISTCCIILGDLNRNRHANIGMANYVHINWGCYIDGMGGLEIGSHTLIGPNVCILSSGHRINDRSPILKHGLSHEKIVIGSDVWIGAGSIILQGVKLDNGCVVGAGSLVAHDVPSYAIVVGNPAKVIKYR
jgi:acetyltransferase-like isoleucine patch superfamily enzyme